MRRLHHQPGTCYPKISLQKLPQGVVQESVTHIRILTSWSQAPDWAGPPVVASSSSAVRGTRSFALFLWVSRLTHVKGDTCDRQDDCRDDRRSTHVKGKHDCLNIWQSSEMQISRYRRKRHLSIDRKESATLNLQNTHFPGWTYIQCPSWIKALTVLLTSLIWINSHICVGSFILQSLLCS